MEGANRELHVRSRDRELASQWRRVKTFMSWSASKHSGILEVKSWMWDPFVVITDVITSGPIRIRISHVTVIDTTTRATINPINLDLSQLTHQHLTVSLYRRLGVHLGGTFTNRKMTFSTHQHKVLNVLIRHLAHTVTSLLDTFWREVTHDESCDGLHSLARWQGQLCFRNEHTEHEFAWNPVQVSARESAFWSAAPDSHSP